MRRWLLITKERDYSSKNESNWVDLDNQSEVHYIIDHRINEGDKILIYRSGQWTNISHIFDVKKCTYINTNEYKIHLNNKKTIPNSISLIELKNEGIIRKNKIFVKRINKLPLCCWSDIIGFIQSKNPNFLDPPKMSSFKGPYRGGCSIDYKKKFFETLKIIRGYDWNFNEEETKYRVILPLLESIGFDSSNINQIYPEDTINERRADYILTDYENNQMCLEAKSPLMELDNKTCKQIRWYCASKNSNLGILTNGIIWRFYKFHLRDADLGAIKRMEIMDEINLKNDKKNAIFNKFIEYLWAGKISEEKFEISENSTKSIIKQTKHVNNLNESSVKQVVVIPLIKSLGWDVYSEKELNFNPETTIHIKYDNKWKTIKIRPDYVLKNKWNTSLKESKDNKKFDTDYSSRLPTMRRICIEAKTMGIKNLNNQANYVKGFCEKKNYDLGILTDGHRWEFFIYKNRKFYDDICLDIKNDPEEKCLDYFQKYLSKDSKN